jgi:hypothetical protein
VRAKMRLRIRIEVTLRNPLRGIRIKALKMRSQGGSGGSGCKWVLFRITSWER